MIPAGQYRTQDAADAVNELRRQGLEVHRASTAFKAGGVDVQAGDYIIRGDQPYRTLADMYFEIQNYSPANPRPYDDTGWTFQLMRNVVVRPVTDRSILEQPSAPVTSDAKAPGGIDGTGSIIIVAHTTDNNLMSFRFKNGSVKMQAAEADFEAAGRTFRAGAFIIPAGDRAALDASLKELGLSAWAVAAMPQVRTHDLDVPRIGYVHTWQRTQDEGWVRAALDTYGVPYTYFADQKLREGNLRQKYDVIVFPHVGGTAQAQVNGIATTGTLPLPYKKTAETPNLGAQDQSEDIRGGMGWDGLMELVKFVQQGGTLITEGSTATIFPDYRITSGVNVESPSGLFVRGSILRGVFADKTSPIAYGYDGVNLPVYFNQDPVLNAGTVAGGEVGGGRGGAAPIPGVGQNTTPMAAPLRLSPWTWDGYPGPAPAQRPMGDAGQAAGGGRGGRGGGVGAASAPGPRPRVVLRFPATANDMLLSGTLAGGEALAGRAQVVDTPLGEGHVVMFAIRPFWRWQTQGTFFLGFNAILNWNDLDAGRPPARGTQ